MAAPMLRAGDLLRALADEDVAFVVVGGMAAVIHGSSHVTGDLDLCYARGRPNLERLARALAPLSPRLRDAPPSLPFLLDAATLRNGFTFTLVTDAGDLDLLAEIPGLGSYEAVERYAERIELYGRPVLVRGLDGLIRAKEALGRAKDLRVLPELRMLRDTPRDDAG